MKLTEIKTPCAIVDLDILERNAWTMAAKAARLGVRLRPHVKTHKCLEAARIQTRGQFGGITVSTVAEARAFFRGGFTDITYAVPVAPQRLGEAADLLLAGCSLSLLLDCEETLADLEACASARGARFPVLLKVDCGYHRAGVDPDSEEGAALARRLADSPHVSFKGLLTHAGHAYRSRDREQARAISVQERDAVVRLRARLEAEGIRVETSSVGSTPTMTAAEDLSGVTEIRPGNYLFFDAFQAAIGSCALEDCAFWVLATVIGTYPRRGELLIDAGALALSKDPGPTHVRPDCGFGVLAPEEGGAPYAAMRLTTLTQEHGQVRGLSAAGLPGLPVGRRLRVIPNHSCLSAACFDRFHVIRRGEVVDEWVPVRGW